MHAWDENGWASGLVEPLQPDRSFALLAPEPGSRIDEGRWAHLARTSVRAVLQLSPAKRYPSATQPMVDVALVRVRHLDRLEEGPAPRDVEVVTVPLERAPAVRALALRGAEAIGGAGFDVLVGRGQRLWQVAARDEQDVEALAVVAVLAAALLAPVVPPGGGTIYGLKGARVRLEALGWRT
jgi:hypothetical protein